MQIMWLVASKNLVTNMSAIRKDTPRSLKNLLLSCIESTPAKKPTFSSVFLEKLKETTSKLPKISRSCSFSSNNSPSVFKRDKTDFIQTKIDEYCDK